MSHRSCNQSGRPDAAPIAEYDRIHMKLHNTILAILSLLAMAGMPPVAAQAEYKGVKVCAKCHAEQAAAWKTTAHAKAFESLKPGVKSEAKARAKLDPAKDYTADANCVGCHVTGYGKPGGYQAGLAADAAAVVVGVVCEACHGPGGSYRDKHGEALDKLKVTGETSDRRLLTAAGQNFDYERACATCHLNYHGSTLAGAQPPYTPFTPAVDARYQFDYGKAVRKMGKGNPVHTHYKLRGVFKGGDVPAIRAEMQETAEDPEE